MVRLGFWRESCWFLAAQPVFPTGVQHPGQRTPRFPEGPVPFLRGHWDSEGSPKNPSLVFFKTFFLNYKTLQHTENDVTDTYVSIKMKLVLTFCHIRFRALSSLKKKASETLDTAPHPFSPPPPSPGVTEQKLVFICLRHVLSLSSSALKTCHSIVKQILKV